METKTQDTTDHQNKNNHIPATAARGYIKDMLDELTIIAEESGQQDLYILLKLASQAARNVIAV